MSVVLKKQNDEYYDLFLGDTIDGEVYLNEDESQSYVTFNTLLEEEVCLSIEQLKNVLNSVSNLNTNSKPKSRVIKKKTYSKLKEFKLKEGLILKNKKYKDRCVKIVKVLPFDMYDVKVNNKIRRYSKSKIQEHFLIK